MRLLAIVIATIFLGFAVYTGIYKWGLEQNHYSYPNAFYEQKSLWVAVPWYSSPTNHVSEDEILWVEVYQSKSKNLLAANKNDFAIKPALRAQEATEKNPNLIDLIAKYKNRKLILFVNHNAEDIDQQVSALAEKKIITVPTIIYSETEAIISSIKQLQPAWLYGSSAPDRLKFKAYESMFLLPATPFKKDLFISPLRWKSSLIMTTDLVQELKRRNKKIIVGPLESKEDFITAKSLGVDGVIVQDPTWVAY
jgi:hypothetical protein